MLMISLHISVLFNREGDISIPELPKQPSMPESRIGF